MKVCEDCLQELPLEDFPIKNGRRRRACRECLNLRRRNRLENEPGLQEKINQRQRDYYQRNKDRHLDYTLRAQYGISLEEYQEMNEVQGGTCAICGNPPTGRLYVDHDHSTGKVRGLLCTQCNVMLGMARDSQAVLSRAISYLMERGT